MKALIITLAMLLASTAVYAQSKPAYKLDARQTQVLSLSNLTDGQVCFPERMVGKVVKRQYDDEQATTITGVTIEHRDGSRDFLNIDKLSDDVEMFDRRWIYDGLEKLLKVGRKVSLGVHRCGAAGRVLFINSIRPAQ